MPKEIRDKYSANQLLQLPCVCMALKHIALVSRSQEKFHGVQLTSTVVPLHAFAANPYPTFIYGNYGVTKVSTRILQTNDNLHEMHRVNATIMGQLVL